MAESKAQMSRFAAIFAGGTLLSRMLGLVRDMTIAAVIPNAGRDMFLFAFKLANMLRDMLGEGAVNAAFIPVLSEAKAEVSEAEYRKLIGGLMTAMAMIFLLLMVLGIAFMPFVADGIEGLNQFAKADSENLAHLGQAIQVMRWTFPYLFLIGMAVFCMAPLFVAKHYGTPSWSPALLNVALIGSCLLLRDTFSDPVWALVAGVWLGGVAQWLVMFIALCRKVGLVLPSFALFGPRVKQAFLLLLPVIFGQAAGEVNKLVDSFFAYGLGVGVVSALFFANRLIQLPLSVFGMAVAVAILPTAAKSGAEKDDAAVRATILYGLRASTFLILPAMIGLMVLAEPLVFLLFQRFEFDPVVAGMCAQALLLYAIGLPAFAWVKVGVNGFYAIQRPGVPVVVASISMVLNIVMNFLLVGPLGYKGLALSTSIAFLVNFLLLYILLSRRFGLLMDSSAAASLGKSLVAALVMGGGVWGIAHYMGEVLPGLAGQLLHVGLSVGGGAVLYAVASQIGVFCKVLVSFHWPRDCHPTWAVA